MFHHGSTKHLVSCQFCELWKRSWTTFISCGWKGRINGICQRHSVSWRESNANKSQFPLASPLSSIKTMVIFFKTHFWCKTWSGSNKWFPNYLEKYQTWETAEEEFPWEHSEQLGHPFHNLLPLGSQGSAVWFQCGEVILRGCVVSMKVKVKFSCTVISDSL